MGIAPSAAGTTVTVSVFGAARPPQPWIVPSFVANMKLAGDVVAEGVLADHEGLVVNRPIPSEQIQSLTS